MQRPIDKTCSRPAGVVVSQACGCMDSLSHAVPALARKRKAMPVPGAGRPVPSLVSVNGGRDTWHRHRPGRRTCMPSQSALNLTDMHPAPAIHRRIVPYGVRTCVVTTGSEGAFRGLGRSSLNKAKSLLYSSRRTHISGLARRWAMRRWHGGSLSSGGRPAGATVYLTHHRGCMHVKGDHLDI